MSGKPREAVEIYNRFVDLMKSCGPVLVAPAKTRVGFQVRMIFAAVEEIDDEVAGWLREAYRVGTQEQLLARAGRSRKANLV